MRKIITILACSLMTAFLFASIAEAGAWKTQRYWYDLYRYWEGETYTWVAYAGNVSDAVESRAISRDSRNGSSWKIEYIRAEAYLHQRTLSGWEYEKSSEWHTNWGATASTSTACSWSGVDHRGVGVQKFRNGSTQVTLKQYVDDGI